MTIVSLEYMPSPIFMKSYKTYFSIVQQLTEELTLTERIETLVPLTYMICFAIAYYGPNAEILGSVKLDLWQFKPILDFDKYMTSLFVLFSVDFLSLIMNGIILQTTCNINIFNVRIMSFR